MKNVVDKPNSKTSETFVRCFEETFNLKLPPIYRGFILVHNGCTFESELFMREFEDGFQQELAMEELFSLEQIAAAWNNVLPFVEEFGVIQIGQTPGHSILCMSITAPDADQIFVYDGDFVLTYMESNIIDFVSTRLY